MTLDDIPDGPFMDPLADLIRAHADRLAAETERWIWKAIAQGIGNRVWRSDPEPMQWPSFGMLYRFQILKPGEPPPGTGIIYGPLSTPSDG